MDLPLVTVFTLIYNTNPRFIIEAIESIRANNYPNLQHIIIDDCSPDPKPKEIVKKWIADNNYTSEFYEHSFNYGVCKTLNHVLKIAKGKYIFGCSDDLIINNKIITEVNILEKIGDAYAATYSDAYVIDENSKFLQGMFIEKYRKFEIKPDNLIFDELVEGNFLPAMAMMWRTQAIRDVGGYDEALSYEDYDLHLRLFKNYKIKYIKNPLAKYRIHNNSLTNNLFNWQINNYVIFLKHIDNIKIKNKIRQFKLDAIFNCKTKKDFELCKIKNYLLFMIICQLIGRNRLYYYVLKIIC